MEIGDIRNMEEYGKEGGRGREEERGRERGNWNMEIEDIREMERERRGRKGMNKRDEKVKIRR